MILIGMIDLKSGVKDAMSKFFYEQTKRRPVVMPVVMEVNQNRRPNSKKKTENNQNQKKQVAEEQSKTRNNQNRRPRQRVKSTPRSIRPKKETIEKINAKLAEKQQNIEEHV